MATTVNAFIEAMTELRPMMADSVLTADAGDAQAGAWPIRAALSVVVKGGANNSLVLPALLNNDAGSGMYVVVNKTATTAKVFCALGDTMNTVLNDSLTIAAGGCGVFVKKKRTSFPYTAPDWSAAAFT